MKLSSGTEISHYRIVREIGSGGSGTVYLADDLSLQRRVAIKILKALPTGDPQASQQLLLEARAAAQQQHPAPVTVYEVGQYHDTPYLVMEYVEGVPLSELLKKGRLDTAQASSLVLQLCEGLQSAHERGMIHGDIKPANVILDSQNRLRILDFGVARWFGVPQVWTDSSISGTLRYMAPEVLNGGPPDPRSDLFSVGVLLYRMLCGQLPFSGSYDAAVIYSIINEPEIPISQQVPDISPALAALVTRLLKKNPDQRFADAKEVVKALHEQRESPSGLRPETVSSGSWRWIGTGLVALVILAGGWTAFRPRSAKPAHSDRVMLAVLPFDNLGAQGDDYFADGVTDGVTHELARNHSLSVIARESAMHYKKSARRLPDIATDLGADFLVTGSIHWTRIPSDSVRINVSVVRPGDDSYIWTESYESGLDHLFQLQSSIAGQVAQALHLKDSASVPDSALQPTASLAAYDLYLRGNELFNRTWNRSDIEFADSLYERAIALDSTFAAAYAMHARVDESMFWELYDPSPARCEGAFNAARRALELDSTLDVGYLSLGYCYFHCNRNYDEALKQFQKGLALHPNQSDLHNGVAAVKRRIGPIDEALSEFQEALRLDPRSHLKAFDVGLTLGMLRRYDDASQYMERTTRLAPDYALAYIYRAWLPVLSRGDTAEAKRQVRSAMAVTDLTSSRYYWWLLRLLVPTDSEGLTTVSKVTDTISFYLYRARMARAAGDVDLERQYSDSARLLLEPIVAKNPEDAYHESALGVALAGLRQPEAALAHGMHAVELLPSSREAFDAPFMLLNLAEILTVMGKSDEAVNQLENVMAIPGFASVFYLQLDPLWAPLRSNPRFQQLLAAQSSRAKIP